MMQLKWIGALLLIGSTTCIGWYLSHRLESRPKHIRQFKNALQLLEAEITYSQVPLQVAFEKLASQLPKPLNYFFHGISKDMLNQKADFNLLWDEWVDHLTQISSYKNSEIEIIKQFGSSLGQHDFTQQQKHIQLTLTHLDRELQEAHEEENKYSKLAKSLGVLSGVFVVLLLV